MIKITPISANDTSGIVCMPLKVNVPKPRSEDWKLVYCPVCGCECWETELARRVIKRGAEAACTMCALKEGLNHRQRKITIGGKTCFEN